MNHRQVPVAARHPQRRCSPRLAMKAMPVSACLHDDHQQHRQNRICFMSALFSVTPRMSLEIRRSIGDIISAEQTGKQLNIAIRHMVKVPSAIFTGVWTCE